MSIAGGSDLLAENVLFESRTGPVRRDGDWGGHPRSHEEDLSWAAKRAAVSMGAATIHATSGDTGSHSDDVVHLCDAIAQELGIHGHERAELLAAAQLHDVGKVAIPHEVLEKPGKLDEREWALIREHTAAGQKIIQSVPELDNVGRLVRHSHERWDGGGYPDGLVGESIPLASRIVFCADAFHAIRSDRPYRRGRAAADALHEVKANAGTQFDPEVAEALVKCAGQIRTTARRSPGFAAATLRSRRLVTLLATLAISGSALAAGGSHVLREDSDREETREVSPTSVTAPGSVDAVRRAPPVKPPAATAKSAARLQAASRSPADRSARQDRQAGSPAGSPRSPRAAAAKPAPGRLAKPRPRRPVSPGRSGEAPRRPAQPGKPVGGAPGRSEEAPGRPVRTSHPAPQAGAPKAPVAQPPGQVKTR